MRFALIQEAERSGVSFETRYRQLVEQVRLADDVGFDTWSPSEHHFIDYDMATISAPEVVLGAMAMVTRRIHLRPAAMMVPFNHPLRIVERIATLDVLSGGRAELGLGRTNSLQALEAFGVPLEITHRQWREAIEVVRQGFARGFVEHPGDVYDVPRVTVVPRSERLREIPIHTTAKGRDSYLIAADLGVGVMCSDNAMGWDFLADNIEAYRQACARAERPADTPTTESVACLAMVAACAPTRDEAYGMVEDRVEGFFGRAIPVFRALGERLQQMPERDRDYTYLTRAGEPLMDHAHDLDALHDRSPMFMAGTPADLVERVRRLESLGCDEVIFRLDGSAHELVLRSIRLIGDEVIPHFR